MNLKSKMFLKVYFWILLGFTIITSIPLMTLQLNDIAQIFFSYVGLISLFGYAYDKKILNQLFWKFFLIPFFLWEIGCYIFITKFTIGSLIVFLILIPLYWSLVCYTYLTHEIDEKRKGVFQQKSDKFFYTIFPFLHKGSN